MNTRYSLYLPFLTFTSILWVTVWILYYVSRKKKCQANKWLLKRNKQRLDRLNSLFLVKSREHRTFLGFLNVSNFSGKSRDVYTLSLRLQLDENIWCLRVGYFYFIFYFFLFFLNLFSTIFFLFFLSVRKISKQNWMGVSENGTHFRARFLRIALQEQHNSGVKVEWFRETHNYVANSTTFLSNIAVSIISPRAEFAKFQQISAGNAIFFVGLIGTGALVSVPPLFHYSGKSIFFIIQNISANFCNASLKRVNIILAQRNFWI